MKIEYEVPDKHKPHILIVGLRYEKAKDGEDKISEVLCRASVYSGLAPIQKIAYAQECERWHHKRDGAVRAAWDADDKARETAKFVVRPKGFKDANTVVVTVTHQGLTADVEIPNDAVNAEANARAAFSPILAMHQQALAGLAAFAVTK